MTRTIGGYVLMMLPEFSQRNMNDELIILRRQRLIRKFWFSKNSDDIIFISAPLLYGKTTAALDAMEELKKKYIYLRFDSSIKRQPDLCGCLSKQFSDTNTEQTDIFDLHSLERIFKNTDAIILDDFQLCRGQAVFDAIKSLFRIYGATTRFIIISRSDLPEELEIYKHSHKIRFITEADLTFSEAEIKKLAEQNRVWIGGAHARRLYELSAGCAGFITESLIYRKRFSRVSELPPGVKSLIENVVSRYIPEDVTAIMNDLSFMDEIPMVIFKNIAGRKNILKKIGEFARETGLISSSNEIFKPHKLLKSYMKSECPPKCRLKPDIYNRLILLKSYNVALDYALYDGNIEKIEDILCYFYSENVIIRDDQLEKLYSIYSDEEGNKVISPFLQLFRVKTGQENETAALSELCDDYSGIKANLNAHIFTVPYPNNISDTADKDLIITKCKEQFDRTQFSATLELLRSACGKYTGRLQYIYYCLLIDTLRNLNMYSASEKEMTAFEEWVQENMDYYELFELFRTKIHIVDCDIEAAKEWLTQREVALTEKINRKNIENRIVDAIAYIALGETDGAIWWLKNVLDFAQQADLSRVSAECLALLSLSYRQKNQTAISISYMEKSIELISLYNCPSIICNLGKDTAFAVEHCYLKQKSKGCNNALLKKLLFYIKHKNHFGGFAVCRNSGITLSKRQSEILRLLTEEYTYSQMAEQLGVKITTVRDHIKRLYEKLEVRNAEDAIVKAREKGIVKNP